LFPSFAVLSATSLFALAALSGCAIRTAEEEVILRYDPGKDALDLLLMYEGVSASDKKEDTLGRAVEVAREVLGRKRAFMAPFLTWDLDEMAEALEPAEAGAGVEGDAELPSDPLLRERLRAILASTALEEVGGFLDGEGRLCAYQRFRVLGFSRFIEYLDGLIQRGVLDEIEAGTLGDLGGDLFDDRTRALWAKRALSGDPWLTLLEDGLEIDLPMTAETFRKVRTEALDGLLGDESSSWMLPILLHVTRFELAEERLRIVLSAGEGGKMRLVFKDLDDAPYDDRLLGALRAEGFEPEEISLEEVREKIAPREASP
jgi:hypothetical protein